VWCNNIEHESKERKTIQPAKTGKPQEASIMGFGDEHRLVEKLQNAVRAPDYKGWGDPQHANAEHIIILLKTLTCHRLGLRRVTKQRS
jgi:hypothetical protein